MLTTANWIDAAAAPAMLMKSQHREIVGALDRARLLYDERSATPLLIEAVDEIFEAARAHFQYEEDLMELQGTQPPDAHRELHKHMLNHVVSMRRHLECFDRTKLLGQLRFLGRWMSAHILDEVPRRAVYAHGTIQALSASSRLPAGSAKWTI